MRPESLTVLLFLASSAAGAVDDATAWRGLGSAANPPTITRADAVARARHASFSARRASAHADTVAAQEAEARALFLPTVALGADITMSGPEVKATLIDQDQIDAQALLLSSVGDLVDGAGAGNPDPAARAKAHAQAEALRQAGKDTRAGGPLEITLQPWLVGNASITASVPLFIPRAFPIGDAAAAGTRAARAAADATEAQVGFSAAALYEEARAAQELVAIAGQATATAQLRYDTLAKREEQGASSPLDVERANLDVLEAQRRERQARAGLARVKGALGALMDVDTDFALEPEDASANPPLAGDEAALVARALAARDDVRALRSVLGVADAGVNDAWARFLPSVRLLAQGKGTTNTGGFSPTPWSGALVLSASLPIFDAGESLAALDENERRRGEARLQLAELERTVASQVRGARSEIAERRDVVDASERAAATATRSRARVQALFEQGAVTATDVADAELREASARSEATRARLQEAQAELALAFFVGD
jgi:outer membrane protein TolC